MKNIKPTQEFVPIKEIRDGVVVLKDGSLHIVLMASTLNFALKSEDEQTAIVMQYQNFLNSLDFPIQFFVQSRKMDIGPYLTTLQEAEKNQPIELLKIQIKEYIEFVRELVKAQEVVSKFFYVVVTYKNISAAAQSGILGMFGGGGNKKTQADRFDEQKSQLQQRADVVQSGLIRCGVRATRLNTEELIELYYKIFNPGELEKEVVGK